MNKKSLPIIPVAFITAAFLAAVIFVVSGIYPGSERTLLIFDMQEQFVSFYAYLGQVIKGASLKYTFEGSLGTPLAGLIAYYLASPLSVIYLFTDVTRLPDAILLVDILKAGFNAASFAYFALFRGIKEPVKLVLLSVCYALSSAAVTFFILPMYLDTLFWLPIIAVWLEKVIISADFKKSIKPGILYMLFLMLCILTHYYSAYMVCIFLILYSIYLITLNKLNGRGAVYAFIRFTFYSLIAGICSLTILMPAVRELLSGKVYDSGVYSNGGLFVIGPLTFLKQLICGSFGGLYSEGGPSVYCTLIMMGFAGYALFKKSNKANLYVSSLILILFVLSFMFRPLYRVWHMFRDPVAYPHRFAFVFVFFVMVLAAEGIMDFKTDKRLALIAPVLICGLLIFNGFRQMDMEFRTLPSASRSDYRFFIDTTADLIQAASDDSASDSEGGISLCRISKDYEFTSADTMLLGFNGLDYFSSSYDPEMLKLYKDLGLLQYHYKACDEGTTILTDMLFGIDYMIHKGHSDPGYEMVTSNGFATLSRNPYSLGIGYLVDGRALESLNSSNFVNNPFDNQELFLNGLLPYSVDILHELEYEEKIEDTVGVSGESGDDGEYIIRDRIIRTLTFTAPARENVYLNFELLNESELDYHSKSDNDLIVVSMNDRVIAVFAGYQKAYNIKLGNYDEDTKITVTIEGTDAYRNAYVYALDMNAFMDAYEALSKSEMIITDISGDIVEGRITAYEDGKSLLLTIPYSPETEVYIDGNKADTCMYAGALLMVQDIGIGEHSIEIRL